MNAEQLKQAQDAMLREATTYQPASLWDRVNAFLWPSCPMCAGWRGVVLGAVSSMILMLIWFVFQLLEVLKHGNL